MHPRRILGTAGALAVAIAALILGGPRVDTAYRPRTIAVPAEVDAFIAKSESPFRDIVPGAEKTIVWAHPAKTRTPLAIVYLHGFSATRQETSPLCDRVAAHFGANLYYARLTGHGRDGSNLAKATVNDWLNDAIEAMEIGKRIGERVIVIGTSTGGTLAAWLVQQPAPSAYACVLLSPNFGPKNRKATVLTWPWASRFAPWFFGEQYHRAPQSAAEARYWTSDYPTTALIPMMGLVKLVSRSHLEAVRSPVLLIYARDDEVVDARETERAFARIGATQKKLVPFTDHATATHHVLAGDILAPANTDRIAEIITAFLDGLNASPSPGGGGSA